MKEINHGNVEEMDHWSKTSSMEPLPVGRHKKRIKEVDVGFRINGDYPRQNKPPETANVYPVVRSTHGVFRRPIDAESNRTSNTGHGKASKIRVDNVESPKITGKMVSTTLREGINVEDRKGKSCLNPNPLPEEEGTTGKRVDPKNENAPFSGTSTSGQRTEHEDKWVGARKRVEAILRKFRAYCDSLMEEDKKKREFRRVDIVAAKWIKKKNVCPNNQPILGSVPGVMIGDLFNYRMELHLLGVHRPPQGGIDSMDNGGRRIAISVVDSGGYDNYMSNRETLIYCGQGGGKSQGNGGRRCSVEEQKGKMGNVALMNSIKVKNPVRVIRVRKVSNSLNFFYDGLYTVEKMWEDVSEGRNLMIKFKLVRMPGQPSPLPRRSL